MNVKLLINNDIVWLTLCIIICVDYLHLKETSMTQMDAARAQAI